MKKFTLGLFGLLAMTSACGDKYEAQAEDRAHQAGKTTVTFERENSTQSTRSADMTKRAFIVFPDDKSVKEAISLGVLSRDKKPNYVEVMVRNLEGNSDAQRFYVEDDFSSASVGGKLLDKMESGYLTLQSDLSPSFVEFSRQRGEFINVGDQMVTAEELANGVRVEFTTVDGKLKKEVKR